MGYGNYFGRKYIMMPPKNLSDALASAIRNWAGENIETTCPGVIVSVKDYATERCVAVLPLIMEEQGDGDIIVPVVNPKVLCVLPGCADGYMSFPPTVGAKVMIAYCKLSLEEFLHSTNTKQYVPVSPRVFGATDAFVLGVIAQATDTLKPSATDFEIVYKDSKISITPDNVITILGPTEVNINGVVHTPGGNVITALGTDLDALQHAFDALKTSYLAHGAGAPNHNPPVPAILP
jgi:hypothetical protein